MFRISTDQEYEERSEGGVRFLFQLDSFQFHDALDADGMLHHFVLDRVDDEPGYFRVDRRAMYEFMARYLAGEYEKQEYRLDRSPAHEALLDLLEEAAARARAGEAELEIDDLESSGEAADAEEEA